MPTLTSFVDLKEEEQMARGLLFTPREIAQQPATWQKTLQIASRTFLIGSGFAARSSTDLW
jgi:hypothetical protein